MIYKNHGALMRFVFNILKRVLVILGESTLGLQGFSVSRMKGAESFIIA